jgi:hypothetical protein
VTHLPRIARLLLLSLAVPGTAWSWGCHGHEIVAYLAYRHLSPAARAGVTDLIGDPASVVHVRRYCSVTGLLPLADVSSWADDVRADLPDTAPWHFIDIPRGTPSGASPARFCPRAGCVTTAITRQLAVLEDAHQPEQRRAEALMYVVHFVGDVHQPLHCTTNDDRGGNCVPVDFFGTRTRPDPRSPHGDWTPNLHAVWDSALLDRAMGSRSPEQYADLLDRQLAGQLAGWQHGTPADWATESHRVADAVVYAKLPTPLPIQSGDVTRCDQHRVSDHWRGFDEELGRPYYDAVRPALDEQLAKAGARLAMLLNGVWP